MEDVVYECQKKWNGSVALCSVGCKHNGRTYKIGEEWKVRLFLILKEMYFSC